MVKIRKYRGNKLTLEVEVDLSPQDSVLDVEHRIQDACNVVGLLATKFPVCPVHCVFR